MSMIEIVLKCKQENEDHINIFLFINIFLMIHKKFTLCVIAIYRIAICIIIVRVPQYYNNRVDCDRSGSYS